MGFMLVPFLLVGFAFMAFTILATLAGSMAMCLVFGVVLLVFSNLLSKNTAYLAVFGKTLVKRRIIGSATIGVSLVALFCLIFALYNMFAMVHTPNWVSIVLSWTIPIAYLFTFIVGVLFLLTTTTLPPGEHKVIKGLSIFTGIVSLILSLSGLLVVIVFYTLVLWNTIR